MLSSLPQFFSAPGTTGEDGEISKIQVKTETGVLPPPPMFPDPDACNLCSLKLLSETHGSSLSSCQMEYRFALFPNEKALISKESRGGESARSTPRQSRVTSRNECLRKQAYSSRTIRPWRPAGIPQNDRRRRFFFTSAPLKISSPGRRRRLFVLFEMRLPGAALPLTSPHPLPRKQAVKLPFVIDNRQLHACRKINFFFSVIF